MRPLFSMCLLLTALAGSADAGFGTIEGRVVGPDGEACRATVRVLEDAENPNSNARVYEVDELGRFAHVNAGTGTVWIRIESPGLRPVLLKDRDPADPLFVQLDAGSTLRGRVVDRWNGGGVAAASVWVCDREATPFGFEACARHTVGADGAFEVSGVPDEPVRLGASSPNHAFAVIDVPARRRADAFHLLQLMDGAPLNGRVVDDRGLPVKGARIGQDEHIVPFTDATKIVFDPPLITDEKGEFHHPGLEARARAVYRGLADGWYGIPSGWVTSVKGTSKVLELKLARPATLQFGLRSPDDAPVTPPIRLVHHSLGAVSGPRAEAGADGRYRLVGLPTRPLKLKLTIDGYQPVDLGELPLGPGKTVDLGDLDAIPGVQIGGTVVDSDGNPIDGSWVELAYDEPTKFGMHEQTDQGVFLFTAVPPGVEITLSSGADGFDTLDETLNLDRDTQRDLTLTPLASFHGRVLRPDGNPATRFGVRAINEDDKERVHTEQDFQEDDGRFLVWPIEPVGRHTIEVRTEGYKILRVPDVLIEERQSVDVGDLHLELGHTLEGIATGPDGSPAEGSRIWISSRTRNRFKESGWRVGDPLAVANRDGRYSILGLSPGFYIAAAQHPDFAQWSREFELVEDVMTETLDIEFSFGAAVHGTARDRSGGPVADVSVGVECPGLGSDRTSSTDGQGYYRIERLPEAQCRIGAFMEDGKAFGNSKLVVTVDGRESRVDFDLSRSIEITGTLRVGGRIAERGFLTFHQSGGVRGGGAATAIIDPTAGRYRTELSEPGEYRVQLESGGASRFVKVRIPDERAVERDFDIPANWILGRVVDTEGNPIHRVGISASNIGLDPLEDSGGYAVSNLEGRFDLKHLESGSYRLTTTKQGYRPTRSEPISVRADTRIENLELVLAKSTSRIHGRLVDPHGAGISEGYVIAAPAGTVRIDASAYTNVRTDGSFVLDTPGDGALDITGLSVGWAPVRLIAVMPAEDREITLRSEFGGHIAVTVVNRKGVPKEGVALEIRAEPPWLGSDAVARFGPQTISGPDGIAVANRLAQGTYRVTAPGGASALVTVTEGQTAELRLRAE